MEEIYNNIALQLQAPEAAMGQYNRIADTIETLDILPGRVKLMETEEHELKLRRMAVDNFSILSPIRDKRVIITNVLYSASDIAKRLHFLRAPSK